MRGEYDNTFYQRGGVKASYEADIMRRVVVNQLLNTTTLMAFTHPVVHLLDTSTVKVLLVDGEVVSDYSTFNDFYGFMTSPQEHLADAERLRKTGPNIEQRIIMTLESRFASVVRDAPQSIGGTKYEPLPKDWIVLDGEGFNSAAAVEVYCATGFPDNLEMAPRFGGEQPKREFLLWSSHNDRETNRQLYAAALEAVEILSPDEIATKLHQWEENVIPA